MHRFDHQPCTLFRLLCLYGCICIWFHALLVLLHLLSVKSESSSIKRKMKPRSHAKKDSFHLILTNKFIVVGIRGNAPLSPLSSASLGTSYQFSFQIQSDDDFIKLRQYAVWKFQRYSWFLEQEDRFYESVHILNNLFAKNSADSREVITVALGKIYKGRTECRILISRV